MNRRRTKPPPSLRGYRLPARRERFRPLHAQVARHPVAGTGIDAMLRAFDFFDRVFGEGKYRQPDDYDPLEWRGGGEPDLDDTIPF